MDNMTTIIPTAMTMKAITHTNVTFANIPSVSDRVLKINLRKKQKFQKILKNKLNKYNSNRISIIDRNTKHKETNNTKDFTKITNCEKSQNTIKNIAVFLLPNTTSTLPSARLPLPLTRTPKDLLFRTCKAPPLSRKSNFETIQLYLKERKNRQTYQKHSHSNTPGKYEKIVPTARQQQQDMATEGDIATAGVPAEITAGLAGPTHEIPASTAIYPARLTSSSANTPLSLSGGFWSSSSPLSYYSTLWPFSTSLTFWRRNHRLRCCSTSSSNPFPSRGNKLFHGIFMTLLLLSICHSNVIETYAASVTASNGAGDIQSMMAGQQQQPSIATTITARTTPRSRTNKLNNFSVILIKDHLPQQSVLTEQRVKTLPQNRNNSSSLKNMMYSEMEESLRRDPSSQSNDTEQILLPPKQKRHQRGHQLPQYLTTTQETSFNPNGITLETTHNHTFQSKSVLDGRLTVPMDAAQQLHMHQQPQQEYQRQDYNRSKDGISTGGGGGHDMMVPFAKPMPVFDFGMAQNITARTGHMEAVIKCRVDRLGDKSVSWIRKRDLHILSVGKTTYTSDKRFQVTESKDSREWALHVKSPQPRDSGIYECQVNTEPKMSMAFQLNIMEISTDTKAVISGNTDLYVKVGSAITLTCVVRQPSIKDIGPIHWYRGGHLLTPFGATDDRSQGHYFVTPAALTSNTETPEHYSDTDTYDNNVEEEEEDASQSVKNEITNDFRQRVALDQQLCDTIKSKLRISNAQKSDSGNYTCQPTTASSASVMVHVINDENPAAMQKSGTADGRSL